MADKESTVLLKYKTDAQSLRQTEAASKKLFASLSTPQTVKQLKATNKEIDTLRKGLVQAERAAKDTADQVAKIDYDARRSQAQQRFGRAGDVATSLSTLGGALGGNPLLQLGADIADVTEQAGLLSANLPPMTGGLVGAGLAFGALGVAVGAAALVIRDYTKGAQEQAEQLNAAIAANRQVAQQVGGGLTTEQAAARLEELEKLITAEETLYNEAARNYDSFEQGIKDNYGVVSGIVEAGLRAVDSREQALSDAVSTSTKNLQALRAEYDQLNATLDEGVLAANDAAEAERQRVAALQTAAEATRQRVITEQQYLGMSTDALNNRVTQLQGEITANQAAADVLRQGGQDASQYEQAIADLNTQIAYIEQTARPAAQAVEQLAEAEKKRQEAAQDAARRSQEIKQLEDKAKADALRISEDYAQKQVDLAKRTAQQELDAQKNLQRQLADLQTQLARDLANQELQAQRDALQDQLDFQRGEAEAARAHADDLEDIQRQAARDERQALRDRDFKALFENRERTRDQIGDAQREYSRERREALIAFGEQADDRSRAYMQEREDRLRQYEQARSDAVLDYQQRLTDLRTQLALERAEIQLAYATQLADLKAALAAETALKKQMNQPYSSSKAPPLSKSSYSSKTPKTTQNKTTNNTQNKNVNVNVNTNNPKGFMREMNRALTK